MFNPAGNPPRLDLSILVVEPRELLRHGVELTMERAGARLVAHASTATRALDVAASLKPDAVILSATAPDMSPAAATRRLLALVPGCQVLVLGGAEEDEMVLEALVEGAFAHLPALATPKQLVERVSLARSGDVSLSQGIARRLWERLRTRPADGSSAGGVDMDALSAREVDVLRLLPTGMDNAEIARALSISPTTVKKHVSSILQKLHLDNRIQAAVRAVRAGIDAPGPRGGFGHH
jgi:DNA-binding NarL/FixJ family response regulator